MNLIKSINTSFKRSSSNKPKTPIQASNSASAFQTQSLQLGKHQESVKSVTKAATGGAQVTLGQQDA